MIQSMTGYGSGVCTENDISVSAEAKSINSRYLELSIRLPNLLQTMESGFAEQIRKKFARGKILLSLNINSTGCENIWRVSVDENLLLAYSNALSQIGERFDGKNTAISLDRFLSLPDVFRKQPDEIALAKFANLATNAVEKALTDLETSRLDEGRKLFADLIDRVTVIEKCVDEISANFEQASNTRFENFRHKIAELLADIAIDEMRIVQEAAILSAKADCTEEIVRLRAHLEKMRHTLSASKPVGSLLNFILQECHREINTIGSKNDLLSVSKLVVEVKEQIERIREQCNNIE